MIIGGREADRIPVGNGDLEIFFLEIVVLIGCGLAIKGAGDFLRMGIRAEGVALGKEAERCSRGQADICPERQAVYPGRAGDVRNKVQTIAAYGYGDIAAGIPDPEAGIVAVAHNSLVCEVADGVVILRNIAAEAEAQEGELRFGRGCAGQSAETDQPHRDAVQKTMNQSHQPYSGTMILIFKEKVPWVLCWSNTREGAHLG